jgi:predicted glycogen debranching enzyme
MIRFDQTICGDLDTALAREWLETNGLGGFASSTIAGVNTRRYHGLLVAAMQPPVGRLVLLSKFEEKLLVDDQVFELSANRYPGVVQPRGFEFLQEFRLDPFPTFVFHAGGVVVTKTIFMVHGENSVAVVYELSSGATAKSVRIELRPLIAFRDYHALTHWNEALNPVVTEERGLASIRPYADLPTLHFAHNATYVGTEGVWYRDFQYEVERERGLEYSEDLFQPCLLQFSLSEQPAQVIASTQRRDVVDLDRCRTSEVQRRESLNALAHSADDLVADDPISDDPVDDVGKRLAAAADQYVVSRGNDSTVIAGYHWFSDWGRDTMISLPGLTLATQRFDVARSILRTFAHAADRGMLPNRFPDGGETPEYNNVDATLWFFEAVRAYLAASNDSAFVRAELYNGMADIIGWHIRGTRYNIHVDADGLLQAGADGVQLTWMDAKVDGRVITPRSGKPVEIQALWYNALCVMADLAADFGDAHSQKRYAAMAVLARWSFNQLFWNDSTSCLYDVVDTSTGSAPSLDGSIRPNQIFAVSLHHGMLPQGRAQKVVAAVEEHLLTPYGLRTLAATDEQYRGRYTGTPVQRDEAYHQGTVWPWLMGPFITAYLRVKQGSVAARKQAAEWLQPLEGYLLDCGVGQLPEIFEGDPPHRPCGCIAQAWSVAELLRVRAEIEVGS